MEERLRSPHLCVLNQQEGEGREASGLPAHPLGDGGGKQELRQ